MLKIIDCIVTVMTSEGPTQFHHSTDSETAIQWSSLKYKRALTLHLNVKVHITTGLDKSTSQ